MSRTRIQSVLDFPVPVYAKQLKKFLGTVNYFRDFMRNQPSLVHALHDTFAKIICCVWFLVSFAKKLHTVNSLVSYEDFFPLLPWQLTYYYPYWNLFEKSFFFRPVYNSSFSPPFRGIHTILFDTRRYNGFFARPARKIHYSAPRDIIHVDYYTAAVLHYTYMHLYSSARPTPLIN